MNVNWIPKWTTSQMYVNVKKDTNMTNKPRNVKNVLTIKVNALNYVPKILS